MAEIELYLRDRLPQQKDNINIIAEKDKEFHVMCDDYDACIDALRYWSRSEKPEAGMRMSEYRELIVTLYDEINRILGKTLDGMAE